jgi:4-hydroxymandelate oxidase
MTPVNLDDYEYMAKQRMKSDVYDYYAGGADDEVTIRDNRAAFEAIKLLPRNCIDVSVIDLSTEILGEMVSLPLIIAPMGYQSAAFSRGELETTKAAISSQTIMTISTISSIPLEEAILEEKQKIWFQLYVMKDRSVTENLVKRAESCGYKAIVVTIDTPVLGNRERDIRNAFHPSSDTGMANLYEYGWKQKNFEKEGSYIEFFTSEMFSSSISWKDISWIRSLTYLPVILKGVLRPEDANIAVDLGISGIIVSNHGGRQLDTTISTIDALPRIVDAVSDRTLVLLDSGIRRGTDVVKALALGADAVMIGRPILWGLAVNGSDGVSQVIDSLRRETRRVMALCGYRSVREIKEDGRNLIHRSLCSLSP